MLARLADQEGRYSGKPRTKSPSPLSSRCIKRPIRARETKLRDAGRCDGAPGFFASPRDRIHCHSVGTWKVEDDAAGRGARAHADIELAVTAGAVRGEFEVDAARFTEEGRLRVVLTEPVAVKRTMTSEIGSGRGRDSREATLGTAPKGGDVFFVDNR